jgi:hypothetical protein
MIIDNTSQMPSVDAERFWLEGYTILRGAGYPSPLITALH